jgi:hypothetical protein
LEVGESRATGERHSRSGEVEQVPGVPGVLRDGDQNPAGSKNLMTGGIDLGHRRQVRLATGVADVDLFRE